MYLLYIDDAGTNTLKKDKEPSTDGGNTLYFVLGGVLLKPTSLESLENKFHDIKAKYFKDVFMEIKYSLKKQSFKPEHKENISLYRNEIYNCLAESDCILFACGQNKYVTYTNNVAKDKHSIYKLNFQHLLYLINSFLFVNKIHEPIIVFIDTKDKHQDEVIFKAYKEALSDNTVFRNFDTTVFSPTINVVVSRYTIGAQLADIVAGAMWRSLESKDRTFSKILQKRFYATETGDIIGYGYSNCNEWKK
ncbi:DUF3800 domain-containing protein [Ectobacillus sp. JY-23]|uniref:DUF3800 domain-containing protein n=1 Tax=Ectobacillus sp. JY-23 TaxID=2933872 RepID=UPI001FF42C27|nr:DUF3800 domain-containing protein [Ectobacillus sp. JY-23]UOY92870.1 DUF3800 domain-containing protein [Ectobacillus sp. JY-23]